MIILETKVYRGRNIYSHSPVIRLKIDLGEYCDIPTCQIALFNQRLLELLPGLAKHSCSRGYEGGFKERLEEGTYLAHVMEHVSIELQNMAGYDVWFGKARRTEGERNYYVIYEYINEDVGLETGQIALELLNSLIQGKEIDIQSKLSYLKDLSDRTKLGPSTQAIVEEVKLRGIPFIRIGKGSILQLGYGKYQKRIEATITEDTSCVSVDIACDKVITKELLQEAGIPVPDGNVTFNPTEALVLAARLGYPVVVKPYDGNQGKGVTLNTTTDEELIKAYHLASEHSNKVVVEKQIPGRHYRVLVVGDNVAAVAERIPAHVVGNGKYSVKELIDIENSSPVRGEGHEKPLTKIKIDEHVKMMLGRQGINLDYIPAVGQKVMLRENGNLSTGGIAVDKTNKIHPQVSLTAVRAAKIIGLDVAGVDITTTNISKPLNQSGGAVIEVNAAPGIRMHHYPSKGKSRNAARSIVDMLFPRSSRYSIPIISITGTNGKTTTARMLSHILTISGYDVGCATTGGIYINQKCILEGDTTGPTSARTVLMDRTVDMAVLETARGGIIRSGLGYDLADVGIITNISGDHLGIDGINTLEDLAYVKSLVTESVKYDGYVVLNADDSLVAGMAERIRSNLIYFSCRDDNVLVLNHILRGKTAVFIKNRTVVIARNGRYYPVMPINEIPCTMRGRLKHNVENVLAVVSGAYAQNIPVGDIVKGLKTFYNDHQNNPGRFNMYNVGNFRVLIDYAHNPAGYRAVTGAIAHLGAGRLVGVIGVPGDRLEEDMTEVGHVCGGTFEKIYIKEDKNPRGRKTGEVARHIYKGVISAGFPGDRVEIELDEVGALIRAMRAARPGDLIVVFYEKLQPVLEVIENICSTLQTKSKSREFLHKTAEK